MNAHQALYFDQAASDWQIFQLLENQPECHRLHNLQMCTEKLAKAYYYKKAPATKGHAGFVKFLRSLSLKKNLWKALGFARPLDLERFVQGHQHLATGIEKLAPQLAEDGPNPEYPWPPPPKQATATPIHHTFPVWTELQQTSKGRKFQEFVEKLFEIFPQWF